MPWKSPASRSLRVRSALSMMILSWRCKSLSWFLVSRTATETALTGFPAQGLPGQLAVLTVGGTVTAIVFLLAALPLGLWEELRAVLRQAKTGKKQGKVIKT